MLRQLSKVGIFGVGVFMLSFPLSFLISHSGSSRPRVADRVMQRLILSAGAADTVTPARFEAKIPYR